jgi:hypothetical protein
MGVYRKEIPEREPDPVPIFHDLNCRWQRWTSVTICVYIRPKATDSFVWQGKAFTVVLLLDIGRRRPQPRVPGTPMLGDECGLGLHNSQPSGNGWEVERKPAYIHCSGTSDW